MCGDMEIRLLIRKVQSQVVVGNDSMNGEFGAIVLKSAVAVRSKCVCLRAN